MCRERMNVPAQECQRRMLPGMARAAANCAGGLSNDERSSLL